MKRNRVLLVGLLLLLIAAIITACGTAPNVRTTQTTEKATQTAQTTTQTAEKTTQTMEKNTVFIKDFKFQPAEITIQKGETITWINQDSARHTATGKSFDSGLLSKGEAFKQTFNEAGVFDYICTPHPYMKGKVTVQ